jgi:iron complex outermembrane recepter protein
LGTNQKLADKEQTHMSTDKILPRSIRAVLIGCAASAATVLPAQAAEEEQIAEVVVTGSRIARPNLEGTTPVLAIGQQDFAALGMENFADVAASLPQFSPAFGVSRTQSTFAGAANSGLNQVNLRNLAGLRTVVLLNGRRLPGGTSISTAVDFNTIPTANVERIEVLTGGAAAIYGADAVAGVINVITDKNFNGFEVGASYGVSEEGDNENPSGHLRMGGDFADRGHAQLTIQYDKQGRVRCADRYLCQEDYFWNNPAATPLRGPAAYSAVGLNAQFFIPGVSGGAVTSRNGSFTDANGQLIRFQTPVDGYNRNAARDIAIPTDRMLFMAEVDYDLTERVSTFVEVNYGQAETDSAFEGHPFQSSQAGSLVGGGPGVPGLQPSIPMNNPFIPTAIFDAWRAANPTADPATAQMTWAQRFNFFGLRGANNDRDTIRGTGGFRGDFETLAGFGSNWHWEVSHVYGRTKLQSQTEGFVGTDRLYNGLRIEQVPGQPAGTYQCADPTARALGCVPINPFGPYTPEMIDYLTLAAGQRGKSELQDTVAFLSGDLFELPAGPLQAALGVERRTFEGNLDYDEVIERGLVTGNQILDTPQIKIATEEAFFETRVPVLRDLPFVHALEVEGAYRRSTSEYLERSEDYGTWKYGGAWAPLDGLRFRVMRARSVRVPTPSELGGGGQTFGVVNDPCTAARRNANPTRAANCLADGVPAEYAPPTNVEQSVAGFQVGSPDLEPEKATTLTYGVIWTPAFVPNLSVTVDRFQIEVDKFVNLFGRQSIANACYDSPSRQFCNLLTRGTNAFVPGAGYVLNAVNDTFANLSVYDISGIDVELTYRFNVADAFGSGADFGGLGVAVRGTFYDKAETVPRPGAAKIDLLGFAGGSTTDQGFLKRQIITDINYQLDRFSANWNVRYIGPTKMSPFATGFPEIGSHTYHNLRFGLSLFESSEVFLGVTNVFDKEPPFFASGTSGTQALDTIPAFYDVFGRSYFAGTKVKF